MKRYLIFISFLVISISLIFISCNNDLTPPFEASPADPPVSTTNKIVFASDRDGDLEIFSLDLGSDILSTLDDTLTQLTNNNFIERNPSLSSDGTEIAFVSDRSGNLAIHTMDSDGSNVSDSLVTLDGSFNGHPTWNPDGTMIAYDNDFDIYTINTNTLVEGQITDTSFDSEIYASWSPDGTKMVFSKRFGSGLYDIYTMDSDGSSLKNLTNTVSEEDLFPKWSSDGSKITFSTNRDTNNEIYTMDSDGLSQFNLTNTVGDHEISPDWSADGINIAYVKNDDIYIRNADGTGIETNITNNISIDQDAYW